MTNLRTEKENRRRAEIKKIEEKKNAAIKELTDKHEKKYNEIKNYYTEITNTNIDIVRQEHGHTYRIAALLGSQ